MNLSSYPFIRIAFCYAFGIVAFHYSGHSVLFEKWILVSFLILYTFFNWYNSFQLRNLLGVLLCLITFGLGTQRLSVYKQQTYPVRLLDSKAKIKAYKARVIESPEIKKSTRLLNLRLSIENR